MKNGFLKVSILLLAVVLVISGCSKKVLPGARTEDSIVTAGE